MSAVDGNRLLENRPYDRNLFHKLFEIFRFENLVQRYPGITSVRAGVCLVVGSHILLVRERGPNSYLGPPKGMAELGDMSALGTALRELHEETGIRPEISNHGSTRSQIKYKLLPETFCCHNDRHNELSVYFVIVASKRPSVLIDPREIESYDWRDMAGGLKKKMSEYSEPTKLLFAQFDDAIVYKRWQSVFSRRENAKLAHKPSLNPLG